MRSSRMRLLTIVAGAAIAWSAAGASEPPAPITSALRNRIAGKVSVDDVRIDAYWSRAGKATSARIFGDGVGIWQRQLQFQISKSQVLALLKAIAEADFGAMPDHFGESEEGEEHEGPRLKGRLTVLAGTASKTVIQLVDGDQSKEFDLLVNRILDACAEPATRGVGATSMEEGLGLLAAGKLSPHVLETSVQRPPDPKATETPDTGWTLRTSGLRATAEPTRAGKAPAPARELTLSTQDFRALANALSDADPASLPQSLYAPRYTDLTVELFSYHRTIAGRRFLGMTPETHGEKQKAFDRLIETYRALHERIETTGKRVATVLPPAAADRPKKEAKEKEKD